MNILLSVLAAPFRALAFLAQTVEDAKRLQSQMGDRWERGL